MKPRSILVYRLGSLGDTVMALPAFHAVRRRFPEARITLLTNRPVSSKAAAIEEVLGKGYFFNHVLDYPLGTRNPLQIARLLLRMRLQSIDTVVNLAAYRSMNATQRDALFFKFSGARHLIGFDLEDRDKKPRLDPLTGECEWEASRIARRVSSLEEVDLSNPANWDLRLSDADYRAAEQLMASLPAENRQIAFCTGTKIPSKHWGCQNWEQLAEQLSGRFPGWTAIFLGTASEAAESDRCAIRWNGPSLNLCGATSPRVSAAIFTKCQLFIGHDSGPMHLAASVGTPCVALFSARNIPRQWFPRGEGHRIIYHRTDCAGCGLEVCGEHAQKCMTTIKVDEVVAAVREVLSI
jgi:ADP-heptose:LPS heptosyltransferase